MLLYNQRKEFIGIDNDDLSGLGFSSINELLSESNDFADLFVKKPGYIHNFKNFSWIDFILHSETGESKAIIHAKGNNYNCTLHVAPFHFLSDESGFAVLIKGIRQLKGAEDVQASKSVEASGGIQATPVPSPVAPIATPEPVAAPSFEESTPSLDISLEDMQLDTPEEELYTPEEETGLPSFDNSHELSEPDLLDIPESDDYDYDLGLSAPTENEFGAPVDMDISLDMDDISMDHLSMDESQLPPMPDFTEEPDVVEDDVAPMLGDYVSAPSAGGSDNEHLSELIRSGTYIYNPQVAADELGLPVDLIEEFIGDFIDQAHEFHDDLFASVNSGDFDNVQILSHKLKGVAANLRVEDAFDVLSVVNISKDLEEVIPNLEYFYKVVAKLEGKEVEEPAPVTAPAPTPTPEPVVQESEDLSISIKQPDDGPMLIDEDVVEMDEDMYDDLLSAPATPEPELEPDLMMDDGLDDDIYGDLLGSSPQETQYEEPALEFETETYDDLLESTHEELSVSAPQAVEVPQINFDAQRSANELGIPVDIVNEFVQDFKEQVSSHRSDFDAAITADDIQGVKKTATLLKGMSDNLRLSEISEVLKGLQQTNDINNTQHELATLQAYADQL